MKPHLFDTLLGISKKPQPKPKSQWFVILRAGDTFLPIVLDWSSLSYLARTVGGWGLGALWRLSRSQRMIKLAG